MPADLVKEFAKNSEATEETVEELWNKYKKQLKEEQGYSGDDLYGTLVQILKNKLKKDYNLQGYDSQKLYVCENCLSSLSDSQNYCHSCGSKLYKL